MLAFVLYGAGALVACSRRPSGGADAALGPSDASAESATALAPTDARAEAAALARAQWEAGHYEGPVVGAANMVVSVLSAPVWPETDDAGSQRLGYLRHGARVPVVEGTVVNEECTDGWYELVQGGWVCGKAVTNDLKSARVKLAPKGPDLDAGLPYRYGYNITDGTPVYRRVLSIADRKIYEPWLAPKPPPAPPPDPAAAPSEPAASPEEPSATTTNTATDPNAQPQGAAEEEESAPEKPEKIEKPQRKRPKSRRETERERKERLREQEEARSARFVNHDGGRGDFTLGELKGRGVLVRRMVRGFFMALDRDFKAANAHWWRTTYGFAVPFDRVVVQPKLSDYHGTWAALPTMHAEDSGVPFIDAAIDAADPMSTLAALPKNFAFVTGSAAVKITVDREKNKLGWSEALPKRRAVALTGEKLTIGGVSLLGTTEGFFVRELDVKQAQPSPAPADLAPNEKWIDVDLTRQMLVAFEGTTPVYGTLISSGRRNLVDKDKDHPTPTGVYRIREKHVTSTMDGDVAADGPYSIEDVPWVMYFQGSFALHGAFWHNGFGGQRSHGCVNLAPDDARALFWWAEPALPENWHGVFATDAHPGTRIVIHEDPEPKRR